MTVSWAEYYEMFTREQTNQKNFKCAYSRQSRYAANYNNYIMIITASGSIFRPVTRSIN
jgi:hypothetical protein